MRKMVITLNDAWEVNSKGYGVALGDGSEGSQQNGLGFWLMCLCGSMLPLFPTIGNIRRERCLGWAEAICSVSLSSTFRTSKNPFIWVWFKIFLLSPFWLASHCVATRVALTESFLQTFRLLELSTARMKCHSCPWTWESWFSLLKRSRDERWNEKPFFVLTFQNSSMLKSTSVSSYLGYCIFFEALN